MITDNIFSAILTDIKERVGNVLLVPVQPEIYAVNKFCFPNVQKKIEDDGGSRVIGWEIHRGKYFIELECHAIWMSADGNLIDITPKEEHNRSSSLFIPDDSIVYNGRRINNIIINALGLKMVEHLATINNILFDLMDKGERGKNQGLITLTGSEATQYIFLEGEKAELLKFIDAEREENSICFCGSQKSFEECHWNNYEAHCSNIIDKYARNK